MITRYSVVFAASFLIASCQAQPGKPDNAKNIILLIGDGMGTSQIYAGLTANKGKLNLERCQFVGFHKNQPSEGYVTDSGAGATSLSIGKKTYNGAIGVDATKVAHPTILEIAERNGLATGLVSSCSVTHATPASFIAHQPSRDMVEEIAADFLRTDVDVFIGGGRSHFTQRKDGKNLVDSLRARRYQVADTITDIVKIKSGKLAGFIADVEPASISGGRGDQLLQSTQTALTILKQQKKGFFLMIEGSQIDWGGHANDAQYVANEMVDFDKAIGAAFDFADKNANTLVIVTADHETGGMALVNGDMKTGRVDAKFTTGSHTGVMIPVFAYGAGAQKFSGIYDNTAMFDKIIAAFGFKKN
ncbi:MAG: alkaline phosphatase [Chitinophagaceae bacterium]|nr:MAG: alkaline phosphatase [Chitinophagaceae bacterium]